MSIIIEHDNNNDYGGDDDDDANEKIVFAHYLSTITKHHNSDGKEW